MQPEEFGTSHRCILVHTRGVVQTIVLIVRPERPCAPRARSIARVVHVRISVRDADSCRALLGGATPICSVATGFFAQRSAWLAELQDEVART